ncbi:MAG TPA: tetratricopeptide repeat protein [Polyangiaceae bacterium]
MTDRVSLMPPAGLGVAERRAMLVGRVADMRELEEALNDVQRRGICRTVTLLGAAGIGKTRLVRDFLVRMRSHSPAPRVFRGAARDQGPAYGVFGRVLRARFGIVEGMDAEAAKAQVRAQAASVLEDRKVGDVVYFLGQLLDLEFLDSPLIKAVQGDPQQLRQLRRAVIKRFLEADASHLVDPSGPPPPSLATTSAQNQVARGPIVLVFDDLHFAHEESLDLLGYLVEYLSAPVLILCLARPEMIVRHDGWAKHGGARHQVIELSPLSDTDASAVMQDLLSPCGDDEAVEDLIDAACTLAGGNPALLEQMVRIFHDMGVLEVEDELAEDEKWKIHVDKLASVRLPITVEDAVQARIAALTPAERELLERAATMGAVFWVGGLLATLRQESPPPDLWHEGETEEATRVHAILRELRERDYVLRLPDSTFSEDEEYVFKHNLERETLLKLTPPGTARRYHAAVADWLASKEYVKTHEESLGMLARHCEAAGRKTQAAHANLAAADVARAQYGNQKAVDYYKRGLELASGGAEVDAEARIRALHHYGDVLQLLGKNDEALVAFREMLAVAYRLDMRTRGGAAHGRVGRLYRDTGRLDKASAHLNAAFRLFEQAGDERGIASTVDDLGKLHWLKGDYEKALEHTQRALGMRRRIGDRRSIALSLNNMGLVYQDSGRFKEALDAFEQALVIRREIGDLVGVAISLNNLGTVAQDQRDDRKAFDLFREAYEVAKETGDRNRIALILTNLGETLNRLGDTQRAITYLKQAEDLADELGDKLGLAEAVRGLGKAYLAQREYTKARECTARAVEIFTEIQGKVQLGIALRSLGEVSAAGSAGGEGIRAARGYLEQSIKIFEEAGNEVELARSCRAFAELLRGTMDYGTDAKLREEAAAYTKRADTIFAKLKLSSYGLQT